MEPITKQRVSRGVFLTSVESWVQNEGMTPIICSAFKASSALAMMKVSLEGVGPALAATLGSAQSAAFS